MPKDISEFISKTPKLNLLFEKATFQHQALKALKTTLASPTYQAIPDDAILSCFVDKTSLIVFCSNPSWTTKLKYTVQQSMPVLMKNHPNFFASTIKKVTIKLSPFKVRNSRLEK